ncbi:MAG: ferrous iron transport protein A [Acidobacteria bacterium]|nr:ferrous iron transport protein A [Acidobacteriota bacterium]
MPQDLRRDPIRELTRPALDSAVFPSPVRLSDLKTGQFGQMVRAELVCEDCELLSALGMTDRCKFRVCKAGDPWIVEVNSTRIGLAEAVAGRIFVIPEPRH